MYFCEFIHSFIYLWLVMSFFCCHVKASREVDVPDIGPARPINV